MILIEASLQKILNDIHHFQADVGNFQLDAPLGHKMRRLTTTNIFNNSGADTDKKQKQGYILGNTQYHVLLIAADEINVN